MRIPKFEYVMYIHELYGKKRRCLGRRRHYTFKKEGRRVAHCNKQGSSSETEECISGEETEEVTEEEEDTDEETFSSESDGFSSDEYI